MEFIDPDAPAGRPLENQPAQKSAEEIPVTPGVKKLILAPEGVKTEADQLEEAYANIHQSVGSADWQASKKETLQQIAAPGFWQRSDCYAVLGQAEFMDRIEAALKTAGFLLNRLIGPDKSAKPAYSKKIITRLAEQLYLLAEANHSLNHELSTDAYIMIEPGSAPSKQPAAVDHFIRELQAMYRQWAHKRRMRLELLQGPDSPDKDIRTILIAVSGLGAYSILQPESGLHVLEIPKDSKSYERINVRVNVCGQPEAPTNSRTARLRQAMDLFAYDETAKGIVVRRYRREPSPLVRDAVRNYRTGLIERVLGGDFDLFG